MKVAKQADVLMLLSRAFHKVVAATTNEISPAFTCVRTTINKLLFAYGTAETLPISASWEEGLDDLSLDGSATRLARGSAKGSARGSGRGSARGSAKSSARQSRSTKKKSRCSSKSAGALCFAPQRTM